MAASARIARNTQLVLQLESGTTRPIDPWGGSYLVERLTHDLAEKAWAAGVPTVRPPGGHAVYLDAATLLPHVPAHELPAVAIANELYLEGGVRGVEIGTLMFGRPDPSGGPDTPAAHELVRLALPRRTYTQSHVDYVGEVIAAVAARAPSLRGYRITAQPQEDVPSSVELG
jgi:tryptophanase